MTVCHQVHADELIRYDQRFCREVMTWKTLRHPNVLSLIGVTMEEKRLVMVSEWMENGNIINFLEKESNADRLELVRLPFKALPLIFHLYLHIA